MEIIKYNILYLIKKTNLKIFFIRYKFYKFLVSFTQLTLMHNIIFLKCSKNFEIVYCNLKI